MGGPYKKQFQKNGLKSVSYRAPLYNQLNSESNKNAFFASISSLWTSIWMISSKESWFCGLINIIKASSSETERFFLKRLTRRPFSSWVSRKLFPKISGVVESSAVFWNFLIVLKIQEILENSEKHQEILRSPRKFKRTLGNFRKS